MSAVATPSLEWDLEVFFPGPDSPEFAAAKAGLVRDIDRFEASLADPSLDDLIEDLSQVAEQLSFLYGYLYCLVSTDTRNEPALAQQSELDGLFARFLELKTRFDAWVGTQEIEADIASSELAREHSYLLRRAKFRSTRLMSAVEESLAAQLAPSTSMGWAKLYEGFSSQIEVEFDGKPTGMAALRNVAYEPDRDRRRRAFELEIKTWKANETPIAAAMNGIKGIVNTISGRRGWESPLHEAAWANAIDVPTLEAMMQAARESFPDFRRYLRAKAKALGLAQLEWYDLFAPLPSDESDWSIERGCDFVAQQFDAYSQKMGDFARRSYRERWIDWNPRTGKVGGAYCNPLKEDISRILMNYDGSFGDVKTLAHELGHGYHALCLADRPPLLRDTPSTLAETASIFCETIVKNAALGQFEGQARVALLEACIVAPCQVVVDITSRFLFERSVFESRLARDVTPSELCEKMESAQRETFGDGVASYHPYMWAAKPHYYAQDSFYNFPYMFGLLFALGLYKIYKGDPDGFRSRYDELLASTGQADAPELCARFGLDCRSVDFWRGSLDVVRADIDEFERCV